MTGILNLLLANAIPAPSTDPYFNYNTLLLPGNGTNGAQNNTFLDSSSNTFTITRNGDTTQGTFSPFSVGAGYWSNYFNASNSDCFTLGTVFLNSISSNTATFTMEAWVYLNSFGTNATSFYNRTILAKGTIYLNFGIDQNGKVMLYHYDGTSRTNASTNAISLNTWTHVAAVVNGSGTITFYINGVANGTATWYGHSGTNQTARLGGTQDPTGGANNFWNGYISNVRTTSTQVYTSAFTPSTTPLTAISGTTFLSAQSYYFVDNSSNGYTLTTVNTPSVQAFSPFLPTAAYSAATNGGSGYFDGTGDYLSFPAVSVGTSAFTFECWVYTSAANTLQLTFGAPNTNPTGGLSIQLLSNGTTVQLDSYVVSNQQFTIPTRTAQSWNHLAVCRDGSNNCTVFWNGTRSSTGSVTNTTDYSGGFGNIGANSGSVNFTGYISGARAVIGSTVYDPTQSSITVPTSPPTAVSNTKLLLNFTNAGIIDNSTKNDLVTVGNAQISTAQSKFGGGSMYFDGTGDFVRTFASNQDLAFRTGNFTVECWVYFNASGQNGILQLSPNPGGFNESTENSIAMQRSLTGQWQIYANSTNPTASATINQSQWYHLAIVRNGTTTTFYVDGTSTITVASDSTDYTGTYIGLGAIYSTSYPLNGYIDDLRITKGIARYTTNFTPPTSAFPLF